MFGATPGQIELHEAHKARLARMSAPTHAYLGRPEAAAHFRNLDALKDVVPIPHPVPGLRIQPGPLSGFHSQHHKREAKAQAYRDVIASIQADVARCAAHADLGPSKAEALTRVVVALANLREGVGALFLSRHFDKPFDDVIEAIRLTTIFLSQSMLTPQTVSDAIVVPLAAFLLETGKPIVTEPSLQSILTVCAEFFGYTTTEILSERRGHDVVLIREVVAWLMRTFTKASLPRIGRAMDSDHSSVLQRTRRFDARLLEADLNPVQPGANVVSTLLLLRDRLPALHPAFLRPGRPRKIPNDAFLVGEAA